MALDVEIKARVSSRTRAELERIAATKGEGWKVSGVVREAVTEYLEKHGTSRTAEQPKILYGIKKASPPDKHRAAGAAAAHPPHKATGKGTYRKRR